MQGRFFKSDEDSMSDNPRLMNVINGGATRVLNVNADISGRDLQGRRVYVGLININDKIITTGVMTILGADKYTIVSTKNNSIAEGFFKQIAAQGLLHLVLQNESDEVDAMIFGQQYHGKHILIQGDDVYVDQVLVRQPSQNRL